jgi:hypothetical protein
MARHTIGRRFPDVIYAPAALDDQGGKVNDS